MNGAPPDSHKAGSIRTAIIVGGLVAGLLDAILAFVMFGWGMPRGIASGLLGKRAFDGGAATWALGLALHFVVALLAATVYCAASRRLPFLKVHFILSGLCYGVGVYLVMNLVVLPLSAFPLPVGPFTVSALIHGLVGHMLIIGLPISVSLRLFSR
jgi:hypothetical protein